MFKNKDELNLIKEDMCSFIWSLKENQRTSRENLTAIVIVTASVTKT